MGESRGTETGGCGETCGQDEGSSVADDDEREVALSYVAARTNQYERGTLWTTQQSQRMKSP